MTDKHYINEDMETLLIQKSFEQLLPEEKSFVLEHVKSPEEYNQLRQLYFQVIELEQDDEDLQPDPKVKLALDKLFEEQSNTIVPLYKKTIFWSSITGIAAIFIIAFFWFSPTNQSLNPLLAENKKLPEAKQKTESKTNEIKSEQNTEIQQIQLIEKSQAEWGPENTSVNIVNEEEVSLSAPTTNEILEKNQPSENIVNDAVDQSSIKSTSDVSSNSLSNLATLGEAKYQSGNENLIKDIQAIMIGSINPTAPEKKQVVSETKKEKSAEKDVDQDAKSGKYYIQFLVNKNGKLDDVSIVKSPNPGSAFDREFLRSIKKQIGPFHPIEVNGQKIPSKITVPVDIHLK